MTNLNKCSLLETLISRGDQINITNGILIVAPISGIEIPKHWLADNGENLIQEIAKLLNKNIYIYDSYSTGNYGVKKHSGITLQFINLVTGAECYVIYNAELTRVRKTKLYNVGSALPEGQFRVTKKHTFYKFWLSTDLKLPARLSAFYDYMGKLKQFYFEPSLKTNNKVNNKIIPLLNISYAQIINNMPNYSSRTSTIQQPYNDQTSTIQQPYNDRTTLPNKEIVLHRDNKGLQANASTGVTKYGLQYQGSKVIRGEVISASLPIVNSHKTPQDQTTDEWLNDWEKA